VQIRRMGFVVLTFVLTIPVISSMALDTPKKDAPTSTSKTNSKANSKSSTATAGGSKTDAKKDAKTPGTKTATKTTAPAKNPK
jgi:hypothetical protein